MMSESNFRKLDFEPLNIVLVHLLCDSPTLQNYPETSEEKELLESTQTHLTESRRVILNFEFLKAVLFSTAEAKVGFFSGNF
ncbi:hypothetical protein [Lyngbya sp. PCC 8106]|uniref:hypothetical protein n=1 Tax=Lyngbya sp. (strain PCC 8106) TaxID=313612 RepID=UPI0000EAB223|nr:hypothetical protein [Lyngbya sp. PCC 8106]EAW39363.1 hypothetical protein L8106_05456 [Lyngbya sp. PCC 8106]